MPQSILRNVLRSFVTVLVVIASLSLVEGRPQPASADDQFLAAGASPSYWIANPEGAVWNFGNVPALGDLSGKALNKPIVGIAPTPTKKGYWLVATDGGIFAYGDARFMGSTGNIKLNKPIVGMTSTPSNNGYWMTASDGGIFAYGDAQFYGSTGSLKLNKPIVGMAATPTNKGYWLYASDGGIFAFGDAEFFGSTGAIKLNKPIVGMTPTPSNKGYWMVASDGGIFAYGDAKFHGSAGAAGEDAYTKILSAGDGKGYWLIRNGGDAIGYGSAAPASAAAARPVVGMLYNITGPGDLAVDYAMRQRGKAYAWGGNGPDTFDCSGLTQQSWLKAGATLPRIANDQYDFGVRVPIAQAKPGDLIFWSNDIADSRAIHHVAMYVGGGNVVTAPQTGEVVKTRPIWEKGLMPFAVRPR